MGQKRVFLAGIGEVGRYVIEFLARDPEAFEIFAGDKDIERTRRILDNVRIGALHHGVSATLQPVDLDLLDPGRTAEQLSEIRPDIIVNCAVLQTWHVIRQLPEAEYAALSAATLGAWLPVQLALAWRLAQSLAQSGLDIPYINTSLSCLTNPALAKVGLAPTVGIGNVDLIQPAVRVLVSRRLNVPVDEVEVILVAHHVHWVTPREAGYERGAPFFLRVLVSGDDVTSDLGDPESVLNDAILLYHPDTTFSAVSASSTVKNIKALLAPGITETHSPAPAGLPGGYPLKLGAGRAELNLPEDLAPEEAIEINRVACRYDGIESFGDDGVIRFTERTHVIMKDVLGFDCRTFHVEESEALAMEQIERYREYRSRFPA